jgi:serine/threonine-protein kinase RIO1
MAELQQEEFPENSQGDAIITESDIERAMRRFKAWASKNVPGMTRILDAEIEVPDETG